MIVNLAAVMSILLHVYILSIKIEQPKLNPNNGKGKKKIDLVLNGNSKEGGGKKKEESAGSAVGFKEAHGAGAADARPVHIAALGIKLLAPGIRARHGYGAAGRLQSPLRSTNETSRRLGKMERRIFST